MKALVKKSVQKMTGYTPGEQPPEGRFVKLNTNENPYPPSPKVFKALAGMDATRLRLYPDPVCRALRERIARIHKCRVSQVFVGNGSDEILALCTKAFVEDNGSIGYFEPSYSLYPVLADIRDVPRKPVELDPEFRWRMPAGYRASLFLMTYPNAPTGLLYPPAVVRAFCRRFPGVVVIDEAYVDFARTNCMALARTLPNVLVMRTLSKSFSLAGLRVGYVVGSERLIEALFKLKDSYNVDRLAQGLALAALDDVAYMKRNVARIRATRKRIMTALAVLGFTVYPSESNFIWCRPVRMAARDFFQSLKKRGILIRYFPGRRTGAFVRITVGTDAEADKLLAAARSLCGKGTRR